MIIQQDQVSDKDIERSLWYLNNKKKIKKIIIIVSIILISILYAFSIFGLVKYLTEKDVVIDMTPINFDSYRASNKAQDLIISDRQIITRPDGKYDIVITLTNPNENIAVYDMNYKILLNDTPIASEKNAFIMPGKTKEIVELNIESDRAITKVDLSISDIRWKKVKTDDLKIITNDIFEIKDEKININSDDQSLRNWVEFKAKNVSPYNLKDVKFYALMYLGSQIVAVNEIEQSDFKSNEERTMQTSWYYSIPSYATLKIEYESNLLDQDNIFIEN